MAEDKKSSRDSHGRWVKGVSGNPKGRPKPEIDSGDLLKFKNFAREVKTPDGRFMMTREAAIQHRLYQSAMQGNVHAQIFLARRFEKYHETQHNITVGIKNLYARIKEEKREPTWAESIMLQWAMKAMHAEPKPGEIEEAMKDWRQRLRRKPKHEDGGGDPSES